MPKLLMADGMATWPPFLRLIVALLQFLEPYLRELRLTDAIRMLYKVRKEPWKRLLPLTVAGQGRLMRGQDVTVFARSATSCQWSLCSRNLPGTSCTATL